MQVHASSYHQTLPMSDEGGPHISTRYQLHRSPSIGILRPEPYVPSRGIILLAGGSASVSSAPTQSSHAAPVVTLPPSLNLAATICLHNIEKYHNSNCTTMGLRGFQRSRGGIDTWQSTSPCLGCYVHLELDRTICNWLRRSILNIWKRWRTVERVRESASFFWREFVFGGFRFCSLFLKVEGHIRLFTWNKLILWTLERHWLIAEDCYSAQELTTRQPYWQACVLVERCLFGLVRPSGTITGALKCKIGI